MAETICEIKEMNLQTKPTFFATPLLFRKWLEKNYDKQTELIVGFYKVNSGKPSMNWSQSVDQALCFGWIDGIRKSIDNDSYLIRFTPRKPTSIWSAVNIKKVEELLEQGLMMPAGIASYNLRKDHKSKIYSYEIGEVKLSAEFEKTFKANKKAWTFFHSLPLSYRKPAINWVMSAKQPSTKIKRLHQLILDSESSRKIKSLSY